MFLGVFVVGNDWVKLGDLTPIADSVKYRLTNLSLVDMLCNDSINKPEKDAEGEVLDRKGGYAEYTKSSGDLYVKSTDVNTNARFSLSDNN